MKRKQCWSAAWGKTFLSVCVVILSTSPAFAQSMKVSKDLRNRQATDNVDIIVQYVHLPGANNFTKANGVGATFKKELNLVNAALYTLPAGRSRTSWTAIPRLLMYLWTVD